MLLLSVSDARVTDSVEVDEMALADDDCEAVPLSTSVRERETDKHTHRCWCVEGKVEQVLVSCRCCCVAALPEYSSLITPFLFLSSQSINSS